tara:strand:+ start:639 stop:956 length:318 start_codon:yes stop_codon:yes gene_type:complete
MDKVLRLFLDTLVFLLEFLADEFLFELTFFDAIEFVLEVLRLDFLFLFNFISLLISVFLFVLRLGPFLEEKLLFVLSCCFVLKLFFLANLPLLTRGFLTLPGFNK